MNLAIRYLIQIAPPVALAMTLTGCVNAPPSRPPVSHNTVPMLLQEGDSITVDLTGTPIFYPTLNFSLAGKGGIHLPLLTNEVVAIGKTPHELEGVITDQYISGGLYTKISVTVTPGPRYFYVSGCINPNGTGKQPYTGKVTVLGAISAAGGFNGFAAHYRVQITRQDGAVLIEDCNEALKNPAKDLEVFPNDRINVDALTLGDILTFKK